MVRITLNSIVATLVIAATTVTVHAVTPAKGYVGDWRIISVNTDQRLTTYPATKFNDPRYVGRVLHFTRSAVQGDLDGGVECQQPVYSHQPPMTLNALIQQTSGEHNDEPKTPVAEDYELNIPGDREITPILLKCQKGAVGPDGVVMKNWIALLFPDRMLTNWEENGYLILQRVKPDEKVSPSFSCSAKLNTVEQTICSDNDLAAWDLSVADAYKSQLWQQRDIDAKDKTAIAKIKADQRVWIEKRNQCQNDTACIKKAMEDRVNDVMSNIY